MITRALVLGLLIATPLAGAAQAQEKDGEDRQKFVNCYDADLPPRLLPAVSLDCLLSGE
jgi:hypothetical protein